LHDPVRRGDHPPQPFLRVVHFGQVPTGHFEIDAADPILVQQLVDRDPPRSSRPPTGKADDSATHRAIRWLAAADEAGAVFADRDDVFVCAVPINRDAGDASAQRVGLLLDAVER
jgi:hypothetical protein